MSKVEMLAAALNPFTTDGALTEGGLKGFYS